MNQFSLAQAYYNDQKLFDSLMEKRSFNERIAALVPMVGPRRIYGLFHEGRGRKHASLALHALCGFAEHSGMSIRPLISNEYDALDEIRAAKPKTLFVAHCEDALLSNKYMRLAQVIRKNNCSLAVVAPAPVGLSRWIPGVALCFDGEKAKNTRNKYDTPFMEVKLDDSV